MNGFHFYAEYEDSKAKRNKAMPGNVVAVSTDKGHSFYDMHDNFMLEAFTAVYDRANSPVCVGSVSPDYLRENCKRVSEKRAREIHPEMFRTLDQPE